ncbi:MAG: hybrid sensor histidine kinase/response regulator, partial [Nitrospirota bacterium]
MNKNQIRIMLIEDNPGDFRLIHEMLKTTAVQFEMDYSDQLSKGLELLEMKEFDVLILDLGLPDC